MRNEFTAIVERDGPWYIAYCAEAPGANGQGKSRKACLDNLREAISLTVGVDHHSIPASTEGTVLIVAHRTVWRYLA